VKLYKTAMEATAPKSSALPPHKQHKATDNSDHQAEE
jgi:hypothetical protein